MAYLYAIALGSNMRHPRFGSPRAVLKAGLEALQNGPVHVVRASPIILSAPLGPSRRTYANAAAILETVLGPDALLAELKRIEADFGRRPGGQAWRARPIDLDILLWSAGPYVSQNLLIPHRELAHRAFVLDPLAAIAPDWRHPLNGLYVRHLQARLDQKRPAA